MISVQYECNGYIKFGRLPALPVESSNINIEIDGKYEVFQVNKVKMTDKASTVDVMLVCVTLQYDATLEYMEKDSDWEKI